ncbi:AI-2 transport protein TqsA [Fervidicola ferrireducens]|jgi:predicted PurR-regulated permease PerM|uniref:AI-2 transport protein TqsA n=1 Tax=Fervidicola ferrireducens TaxID=520764 RepID=A0A140L4C7_9FIRM|nr:AI-2E family transporter [Fervidicola ferrireducens]KXG75402.1 AI-2 transport protein TqsA [Fervidicola ferrireducens]
MHVKYSIDRNFLCRLFLFIALSLLAVLIYKVRGKIYNVLLPCSIGVLTAYILNPIVVYLTNKGFKRKVAVALIYFILICSVAVAMFCVIPVIISELNKLIESIPFYAKQVQSFFNTFKKGYRDNLPIGMQEVIDRNIIQLENRLMSVLQNLTNRLPGLFSGLFSFILGPIIGFYLLKDLDELKKSMAMYVPSAYRDGLFRWMRKIDSALGRYIRGQLTVSFIVGILTSAALYLLGIDYALLIGILSAITNIIPYFGPIIGAMPAIAIALLKYPGKIFWIVIVFALIQQLESGIISPHIMGENLGLHPVTVIFSLLVGGTFFGLWGLILAVPAAALLKSIIIAFLEKLEKEK